MFDFLSDNLLIICPNSYKNAILNYLTNHNLIFNIKFMTKEEYLKRTMFDYGVEAIHYLVKKDMKVFNAITILDNLYYIENRKYNNGKLDYLVNIKKELDDHNLLIYDSLFSKILKERKIIVCGYGKLDSFEKKLFSKTTIIPYDAVDRKYDIYHFKTLINEVEFVFQRISELLNSGVNIEDISLMNIDNEYIPYIKMMEKFYEIGVDLDNSDTIMGTVLGQKFYSLVCENYDSKKIISELKLFEEDKNYYFIIDLLDKYMEFDLYEVKDEIKYELLNHKVEKNKVDNVVKVKDVFDYVSPFEHVFLLNFNNSSIPKLKMDTDYITDDISSLVGVDNKEVINELIKANTLNYLSSIQNIIISYKEKSFFNIYYPSILLDYMDYKEKEWERSFNYSEMANKSLFTMYLDDYVKYGIKNKDIDLLYSNYGINNYLSYNNQFTNINKKNLLEYLNNELLLSYSSINNYYQCNFKYYLSNILKIDSYEETFSIFIGHLFHYVLSRINEKDFDFEKEYNLYINDKEFSNKERFFLDKLKKDLLFIIETIHKHEFISGFTNMLYEKRIDIKLMDSPYVHFTGVIDKVMYYVKDNDTLVSVIDYKTGNLDMSIKNIKFGLSMQLPIYFYLIKNSNVLKNIKFTGFYLQNILNVDVKKKENQSLEEEKYNNLKLTGYSTTDLNRLGIFDSTYENSEMIKGVKINKDGTISKLSKMLSDDEINEILMLTHEKIMEAINKILEGEFLINPKILNGKNVSCEHCHFKDLCYHQDENNVYLKS